MICLAKSPAILKFQRISQALPSPSPQSRSNHLHILKIRTVLTSAFEDEYMFFPVNGMIVFKDVLI